MLEVIESEFARLEAVTKPVDAARSPVNRQKGECQISARSAIPPAHQIDHARSAPDQLRYPPALRSATSPSAAAASTEDEEEEGREGRRENIENHFHNLPHPKYNTYYPQGLPCATPSQEWPNNKTGKTGLAPAASTHAPRMGLAAESLMEVVMSDQPAVTPHRPPCRLECMPQETSAFRPGTADQPDPPLPRRRVSS